MTDWHPVKIQKRPQPFDFNKTAAELAKKGK